MAIDVKYLKSAVFAVDYPDTKRPEVAIAGRSNSGKSSFINSMTRSSIAKVSQEPGKTRLLNFFDVGNFYRIVDMPGYGFASRSGSEVNDWEVMVETYLSSRENFVGLLLIMDIRRDWSDEEALMVNFMHSMDKPVVVILTKEDQLKRQEIINRKKIIQRASGVEHIFSVSNSKYTGVKEAEDFFFKEWIK
jgi:GTP-binding protein